MNLENSSLPIIGADGRRIGQSAKQAHRILSDDGVKMYGVWTITIRDAKDGYIKRQYKIKNLIPTVGRAVIANNLTASSPTYSPRINYTALGTGTASPANSDTTLATEVYRKATASATNSANVAYVTAFYTAVETTGTYKEAGLFIGATGTANSGALFSRVLLNAPSGITKSGTETLTIDYTLTIS